MLASFTLNNGDFVRSEVVELIDEVVDLGFKAGDVGGVRVNEYLIDEGDDGGLLEWGGRQHWKLFDIHRFEFIVSSTSSSGKLFDKPP